MMMQMLLINQNMANKMNINQKNPMIGMTGNPI